MHRAEGREGSYQAGEEATSWTDRSQLPPCARNEIHSFVRRPASLPGACDTPDSMAGAAGSPVRVSDLAPSMATNPRE